MDILTEREKKIAYDKRLGRKIIWSIFFIHAVLLAFFWFNGVTFMVCVNVCSLITYLIVFSLIDRLKYEFLIVSYLEILIHSCLATLCVGWDFGFELYCFSLIPVFFYCDYLAREIGGRPVTPLLFCAVDIAAYIFMRTYTQTHQPYYLVADQKLAAVCYTINLLIVFSFSILYVATFERMTRRSEKKLLCAANRDALTSLRNRRCMESLMRESLLSASDSGAEIAVAMLDINDFKGVNDRFGHLAGDRVLRAVSDKIAALEDDTMHVCRWGGDEFLFLSTGADAFADLQNKTAALAHALEAWTVDCSGVSVPVSVTVGCAAYDGGPTLEDAIRRADEKLYMGKDGRTAASGRRA